MTQQRRGGHAKPVRVDDMTFPHAKAVAEAYGCSPSKVRYHRKQYGEPLSSDMLLAHGNCVPVRIKGVDYPSCTEAATALGLEPYVIVRALDAGRLDTTPLIARAAERAAYEGS